MLNKGQEIHVAVSTVQHIASVLHSTEHCSVCQTSDNRLQTYAFQLQFSTIAACTVALMMVLLIIKKSHTHWGCTYL